MKDKHVLNEKSKIKRKGTDKIKMCEKQRAVLDALKGQAKRGGLSKSALLLHEKQCEEFEAMNERMTRIESKFDTLEKKFDAIDVKIDIIARFFTGWRLWAIFLIFIAAVALAGQRLIDIITHTPIQ